MRICACVKGTYCLILELPEERRIRVGARGFRTFPRGTYVYVGSALAGIERRIARHMRSSKKKRWHIDYLLDKALVVSTVAMHSGSKRAECEVARALLASEGAEVIMRRFGSSDCGCPSHLIYFGAEDRAWVAESVVRAVAVLACAYPAVAGRERE